MTQPPDDAGLAPSLPSWDVDEIVARWVLDQLSLPAMSDFAVQAMLRGHDGPALRELAWSQSSWNEAYPLCYRALAEVGLPIPTVDQATHVLARQLAQEALDGRRPLVEAARAIARLYYVAHLEGKDLIRPEFNWWDLDLLLDDWTYSPYEDDRFHTSIRSLLGPLAAAELPETHADDSLAPTLGGTRAAPEPPPPPPEAPEEPPSDDAWRFEFHFNFDINLRRFFTWNWSWNNRQR
jgi:hypothetical protein